MSDIVTRLRMRPTIVRTDQFGSLETDRAATKLFDDVHALMREAADEIDRLRAEVAALKAERDEARRALCMSDAFDRLHDEHPNAPISLRASIRIANEISVGRGWDCFDAKEAKP
jgi:hypothetical protein